MPNSIKKNFAFNSAYQMLNVIVPLITTPYLSRTIGASGNGVFTYTQSIANYFVLFAQLGITNYGVRDKVIVQRQQGESFRNVLEPVLNEPRCGHRSNCGVLSIRVYNGVQPAPHFSDLEPLGDWLRRRRHLASQRLPGIQDPHGTKLLYATRRDVLHFRIRAYRERHVGLCICHFRTIFLECDSGLAFCPALRRLRTALVG